MPNSVGSNVGWLCQGEKSVYHQTCRWYHPNGGILTYKSCMDTAYVRENPPSKQPYKDQYLHSRYLKVLVSICLRKFQHTPGTWAPRPEKPPVYGLEILSTFIFSDTWGMFKGSVGIPPSIGNHYIGYINPTIGLMTIPYYLETIGD